MQINCTVLIQIINFWITYIFLRKILLKPIIDVINKKKNAKNSLATHLKNKENFINTLADKKNKELTEFKDQLQMKYKPPKITYTEIKTELLCEIDTKKIDALINSSKNLITTKVGNAL